jgi:hypothetical protein
MCLRGVVLHRYDYNATLPDGSSYFLQAGTYVDLQDQADALAAAPSDIQVCSGGMSYSILPQPLSTPACCGITL